MTAETPPFNPKSLLDKKPDYQNDSFASWLEKTLFTSIELGDLNELHTNILAVIEAAADSHYAQSVAAGSPDPIGAREELNLVSAINETYSETRRVLIRAIGMS